MKNSPASISETSTNSKIYQVPWNNRDSPDLLVAFLIYLACSSFVNFLCNIDFHVTLIAIYPCEATSLPRFSLVWPQYYKLYPTSQQHPTPLSGQIGRIRDWVGWGGIRGWQARWRLSPNHFYCDLLKTSRFVRRICHPEAPNGVGLTIYFMIELDEYWRSSSMLNYRPIVYSNFARNRSYPIGY